ncbi:thiamine biosynthetic bifunctional enzyme [Maublancomyces gigas]|uniref:hydroxyethylthiazole kinase n=1 Tax=Discina gigas TaxID=1032678 RepID=A0ABR3GC15_9PEZI
MTGATDIVSDGQTTYLLRNGDPIQTRVTGIGCSLSSFIAATISDSRPGEEIVAVIAAISAFNVAAEKANAEPKPAGPASWAVRFLDILATGPQSGFETDVKIEEIIV